MLESAITVVVRIDKTRTKQVKSSMQILLVRVLPHFISALSAALF